MGLLVIGRACDFKYRLSICATNENALAPQHPITCPVSVVVVKSTGSQQTREAVSHR